MANYDVWSFLSQANNYTIKMDYDGSGNQIYIGWTQPGSATSDTAWRIQKVTYNASNTPTDYQWPSASTSFNFVWDNRTTYTYS